MAQCQFPLTWQRYEEVNVESYLHYWSIRKIGNAGGD